MKTCCTDIMVPHRNGDGMWRLRVDHEPVKSCPFCGLVSGLYVGHAHALAIHVQCQRCGASGGEVRYPDRESPNIAPEGEMIRLAATKWNQRAAPTEMPVRASRKERSR